ncbi:hypothetical protein CBR_g23822 [Chara braunii]|uniref:Protein YIP n=1 Tax=Chara braunii TaxID=69332 RepID=A0A388JVR3_CHABU|nr:hypothetical protein CBR_g23822 [Chara braunii]|eukprot:GBG61870.1 hypothetical protein CBR_g23822 [Chara braunii]
MMNSEERSLLPTSDIDEIEGLFRIVPPVPNGAGVSPSTSDSVAISVGGGRAVSPASVPPVIPTSVAGGGIGVPSASSPVPTAGSPPRAFGFTPSPNTLTEPVWDTLKRDLVRIAVNLRQVVFPNPSREDPGKALRDWDLWGPFFFIILLALTLSSSASQNKAQVFAVVFAVLSAGALILTLNVLLLGGKIIFFQSLSVLGYCLFPVDIAALLCLMFSNKWARSLVVLVTLAWSSWATYPFMSTAVPPARKALALYPVCLMYISIGFLVLAND